MAQTEKQKLGAEGYMSVQQACEYLGGMSRSTLFNLIKEGHIRRGTRKRGRTPMICRASVMRFALEGVVEGPTTCPVPTPPQKRGTQAAT